MRCSTLIDQRDSDEASRGITKHVQLRNQENYQRIVIFEHQVPDTLSMCQHSILIKLTRSMWCIISVFF